MALFSPVALCAVCKQRIADVKEAVGLAALSPTNSDFADFYDACAHRRCLKEWRRRDEFVVYYNRLVEASAYGRLPRLEVTPSGDVEYDVDRWRSAI